MMRVHQEPWAWDGPTITFVIPWYGAQVSGGAEHECRRTAEELNARGIAAEVFTTTAGGLKTNWMQPAFAVGTDDVHGVRVHRFAVRPSNLAHLETLNVRLLRGETLTLLEQAVFVREIIGSDALEAAIVAENAHRLYIFIPYMFGTSYWGMPLAHRSCLIPCLHDEAYAYMVLYRQLFETAQALIFHSPAELRLAQQLYDFRRTAYLLLGEGVDATPGDAARFRHKYGIDDPFILYAGRRDALKNTPLLFESFSHYRQRGGTFRLVCIGGPGEPPPPDLIADGSAVDLGFLPAADKHDAYAAASVLCQPSLNESFSLVVMEAWACETPTLVHTDCTVTREFCELSGGGLHFRTLDEFIGCLEWLRTNPSTARSMGQAGAAYVQKHFTWDAVLSRLLTFLRTNGMY
jgi:glycosyltransferase involved in cell wall biosynthesis